MFFNKRSYYKILFLSFSAIILSLTACVQFKPATLYDGVEVEAPKAKPTDISLLVEPLIYNEDATDVWGLEKNVCQEASVSTKFAHSGEESLKLDWNRNAKGCKFSGIGIGWDGYAGKDLTEVMDHVAIQMFVRTQKGRSFGLPMVLTLEDYSGGMGFCYTSNKYFERTAIDEEWQKVIVPLNDFDLEVENLDPSNIKQLQIELQQSGSIYLDDISLVFYTPVPQKPWMEEEVLPNPLSMPKDIFTDQFINNNSWGLISDKCQKIELSNQESSEGEKSIHVKWDNTSGTCRLTSFGVSWNKWHPVDVTSIRNTAAFEFDLKSVAGDVSQVALKVGFEDYDRAKSFAMLKAEFIKGKTAAGQWTKVKIPFSAIPKGVNFTKIKQLYFDLEKSGEVYIDNIKLVRL